MEQGDILHFVDTKCLEMGSYLSNKVGDGSLKDKLHDQLIWLKYQLDYSKKYGNTDLLQENYDWVVSNFNHDLQLQTEEMFNYLENK